MSRLELGLVPAEHMGEPSFAGLRAGVQSVFESSGLASGAVLDMALDLAATHVLFLQQGRSQEVVSAATLMRDGRRDLEVVLMGTAPNHARNGYGSALLDVIEGTALDDGTGVRMSVESHRLAMRSLVVGRGYQQGRRGIGGEFSLSYAQMLSR